MKKLLRQKKKIKLKLKNSLIQWTFLNYSQNYREDKVEIKILYKKKFKVSKEEAMLWT